MGQMVRGATTFRQAINMGSIIAETAAWVAAVVAAGGSVSAGRQTLVNSLIVGLKADGVWNKLDRAWVLAAENTQSALIDIKGLATATANGSPTFTVDQGYTGVQASATVYLDTGFTPSSSGVNFTQNSAHISGWSNTNVASLSTGGVMIGCSDATGGGCGIFPRYSDGKAYYRINDTLAGQSAGVTIGTSQGFYVATRSGAAASKGYANAVDQSVVAVSSAALASTHQMAILGYYDNSNHRLGFAGQVSAATIGGDLSSADVTALFNRLGTYRPAVGL